MPGLNNPNSARRGEKRSREASEEETSVSHPPAVQDAPAAAAKGVSVANLHDGTGDTFGKDGMTEPAQSGPDRTTPLGVTTLLSGNVVTGSSTGPKRQRLAKEEDGEGATRVTLEEGVSFMHEGGGAEVRTTEQDLAGLYGFDPGDSAVQILSKNLQTGESKEDWISSFESGA